MSTITKEFTKEQLQQIIETDHVQCGESSALARIALASLEAEAVCVIDQSNLDYLKSGSDADVWPAPRKEMGDVLLYRAAPPAPVSVPDEATPENIEILASTFAPRGVTYQWDKDECNAATDSWNACRAAMLQSFGNSEQLNSPVTPDGWVMVPVEPTEDMIVQGFESEPDESFSDADVWEAYEAMSGCQQAAHRAKLCWAAMIAAAPQQEVK